MPCCGLTKEIQPTTLHMAMRTPLSRELHLSSLHITLDELALVLNTENHPHLRHLSVQNCQVEVGDNVQWIERQLPQTQLTLKCKYN